ncbi:MAG TPA: cytochrome P450 [Pseudonocardia sp.]|nr:cytochrome P450 [Pseudonocardia sp.]
MASPTGTCPAHAFDPFTPSYLADPYPALAAMREQGPVFYSPVLDMWVVTRFADIDAIFRRPETFSAAIAQDPLYPLAEQTREVLAGGFRASATMSNCDPPKHTRIRRYNLRSFSARRIAVLEPKIRARAEELVESMLRAGEFDLVEALTFPLPAYMIFTLIGFPAQDTELLKSWCGNRTLFSWGRPSVADQVRIAENMVRYWQYCERFVDARIAEPLDDFTSDLARVHRQDPGELSRDEIVGVVYGLSFAGHETTTNLTTNAVRQLLAHRAEWEAICTDPTLIPNAVEEVLRYDTSVVAWRRITTAPVEIGAVAVPERARLLLLLASANRDPRHFADPERFDIRRTGARDHLALGKGIHFCLGAPLARLEVRIVLELISSIAPDLELVPGQHPTFPPNVSFRGPEQLLLRRSGIPGLNPVN